MDDPDDDAVKRFELWERALDKLQWLGGSESDLNGSIARAAMSLCGVSSFIRMKREAVINAARQEGDEHLPRLQKAFPGLDLSALVRALRVKAVELRLSEGL